jgi:hypothetical protein
MNVSDIIQLLTGKTATAAPVQPPPFVKDQSRVINTPYPPPLAEGWDVKPGLMLPGAAPVLPQGFTRK